MSSPYGLRCRAAGRSTNRQPFASFSSLDQPLGLQPGCVVETKVLGERGIRGRVETDQQECRCERQREIARARNTHQRSFLGGKVFHWRKECAVRELYMGMLAAIVTDCGSIQSRNSRLRISDAGRSVRRRNEAWPDGTACTDDWGSDHRYSEDLDGRLKALALRRGRDRSLSNLRARCSSPCR